jgi:hypothetical protein
MSIEKILGIKFNKKQKASATALRWIISDGKRKPHPNGTLVEANRATGRSLLVLALIIEQALKNRGKEIQIFDHVSISGSPKHRNIAWATSRISSMLGKAGITNFKIVHRNMIVPYLIIN